MLASEISRSQKLDDLVKHGSGYLAEFARSLKESPGIDIETFLAGRPAPLLDDLIQLVAVELKDRLARDPTYRIEHYLQRFPQLGQNDEQLLDLIYAEYVERRRREPGVESKEYYERFPDLRGSLERLFLLHGVLEEQCDSIAEREAFAALPSAGSRFLDFRLKSELGRGAFGRVFLAEQESLSNRYVVLKISQRRTIEHRIMARLEHPNIVPVLSVHTDDATGLQAVCMPYQYAAALSDVKKAWTGATLQANRADSYLDSVKQWVTVESRTRPADREATEFPRRRDFVYATAWIMHKLARALEHAHVRNIYHRDLKPSNILLSVTGHPLLVDFNLSFDRLESSDGNMSVIGGTPAYMAPEHIQALHPIEQGRVDDVGPRADIFSLAVTAFELLTGWLPFGAPNEGTDRLAALLSQFAKRYTEAPSVREYNPWVPEDLAALLSKCLDPISHRRYDTAGQLADDLERFLHDRPLRHIPMVPLRDRGRKFIRRNRRRLIVGCSAAAALSAASLFVVHSYHKAHTERLARQKSEVIVSQLQKSADKEADEALARQLKVPDDGRNFYRCFLMGRESFLARQYAVALRCFSRAIELNSSFAPNYYYRGRSFANLDKDGSALDDFCRAIELDPTDVYSYLARATFYATSEEHSNTEKALDDLKKTYALLPPQLADRTKGLHLDIARALSAISDRLADEQKREEVLLEAEDNLIRALELGLELPYLKEAKSRDRFHMLDAVFKRPRIQRLIAEKEKADVAKGRN